MRPNLLEEITRCLVMSSKNLLLLKKQFPRCTLEPFLDFRNETVKSFEKKLIKILASPEYKDLIALSLSLILKTKLSRLELSSNWRSLLVGVGWFACIPSMFSRYFVHAWSECAGLIKEYSIYGSIEVKLILAWQEALNKNILNTLSKHAPKVERNNNWFYMQNNQWKIIGFKNSRQIVPLRSTITLLELSFKSDSWSGVGWFIYNTFHVQ